LVQYLDTHTYTQTGRVIHGLSFYKFNPTFCNNEADNHNDIDNRRTSTLTIT